MTTDAESTTAITQATAVELALGIGRIEGQQTQTNEILRAMSERMDRQDARMDRQDARMDRQDARMDRLEAKLDRLESKLDRLPWFGLTLFAGIFASMVVNYFVG